MIIIPNEVFTVLVIAVVIVVILAAYLGFTMGSENEERKWSRYAQEDEKCEGDG